MAQKNITAVILAAGRSTRMGQFKPLLKLGEKTVIERSVSMFIDAGIDDIRVVVGHFNDQMEPVLEKAGVRIIVNRNTSPDMFSSVLAALESLDPQVQSIIILPGDVPLVRPWTVKCLLKRRIANPRHIMVPIFKGKRGHPVVIPAELRDTIRGWKGEDGLKGAFNSLKEKLIAIPVADANILFDMDTPEDYEEAKTRWSKFSVPARDECMSLLREVFNVDETIIAHCSLVADLAGNICDALIQCGYQIEKDIVTAAGLLHDMTKGESRHELKAAGILSEMGFPEVASVVADHTDIECSNQSSISSSEVLYLADKLVKGNKLVPIDKRFQNAFASYGHDPEIRKTIEKRMENAYIIMNKVMHAVGRDISREIFSLQYP